MKKINVIWLGTTSYNPTWDLQRKILDLRVAGKLDDVLLLNEHHHVYTLGKSSDENHLLAESEEMRAKGVEVFHIDRGGDVTYHGPGQIVGYPILDLHHHSLDLHKYLRDLEEVIIRTLAEYGIEGKHDSSYTGVWVGSDKIAAIGVKVSRWVTMHGFAFNINTDLSYFDRIIPCGIFHRGVTSLRHLLGKQVPIDEVEKKLVRHFGEIFQIHSVSMSAQELLESIQNIEVQQTENYQPEHTECLQ